MSANDIYFIREISKGRYNVSHEDVEQEQSSPSFVHNITLDEALDCVESDPAEYGYRIIRMKDRQEPKDFEKEARRQSRPDDVT